MLAPHFSVIRVLVTICIDHPNGHRFPCHPTERLPNGDGIMKIVHHDEGHRIADDGDLSPQAMKSKLEAVWEQDALR